MFYKTSNPVLCFNRWTRKGYAIFASLHRVVKIGVVTFACTLVQLSYEPLLADVQDSTSRKGIDLDEVEVSEDQPVAWSPNARLVQVTERREISSSPAKSLDNLLESIAGVDIRQRGSDGVQADVSIRGGSFDQVLILLNGVNITDPQTGHFSLDLPVELQNIQRIELLQGPSARIWGPNAYSGVINIVTGSDTNERGTHFQGQIGSGSFGFLNGSGSVDYNGLRWNSMLSASYKKSDGYVNNTDFDFFNSLFQTKYRSNGLGDFQFQAGYQQKAFGANSFYTFDYPNQFERTKTLFSSLNWEMKVGKTSFEAKLSERIHHDRFELFRNSENAATWYTGHNYHLTSVTSGNLMVHQRSSLGKTTVGMDFRSEQIFSNVLGVSIPSPRTDFFDETGSFTKSKSRTNWRLFVDQTVFIGDAFKISGGFSGNLNTDFKPYMLGGMDASYHLTDNLYLNASVNHSYRLPTFTDLYYKSKNQISNPNLKPEQSTTYELGTQFRQGCFRVSASGFYRRGTNVIDWIKLPDSTKWISRNETSIHATGGELTAEYKNLNKFVKNVRISFTEMAMDKLATGYDSKYALDYLRNKINMHLEHDLCNLHHLGFVTASWNVSWQDRAGTYQIYTTGPIFKYEPYWMTDLRLSWQNKGYRLNCDLNNLFDIPYADIGGLPQPGRSIRATLLVTI
ncbi:MAG TPA: TonB-dependent receptor [Bacteroidales bacterium]|nr:TonB-dependent receptor [Bacteroidales bacterium]